MRYFCRIIIENMDLEIQERSRSKILKRYLNRWHSKKNLPRNLESVSQLKDQNKDVCGYYLFSDSSILIGSNSSIQPIKQYMKRRKILLYVVPWLEPLHDQGKEISIFVLIQGTYHAKGALLHHSCGRCSYYSGRHTNRGGCALTEGIRYKDYSILLRKNTIDY